MIRTSPTTVVPYKTKVPKIRAGIPNVLKIQTCTQFIVDGIAKKNQFLGQRQLNFVTMTPMSFLTVDYVFVQLVRIGIGCPSILEAWKLLQSQT